MLESGHASIMAKNFGAPYWRALRMRLIMALTAAGPGLWDIMVNVGAAANPPAQKLHVAALRAPPRPAARL